MKRREQIEKEATNYINSDAVSPMNMQLAFGDFINGEQWADKTMIEKACYWMKEQVYQEYGGGPLERLIPDTRIEDFRKAMEE